MAQELFRITQRRGGDKRGRRLRRDNENVKYKREKDAWPGLERTKRRIYSRKVVTLEKIFGPPIPPDNSLQ